jgi:uncharacterized protein
MRQETLVKITTLLRTEISGGLTILQISKKLDIGYRPAYMHINSMENDGIIIVKKIGNAKQCTLNLKNERCRHLLAEVDMKRKHDIYKKHKKLELVLENLISRLSEKAAFDMHSVVLFGSYAKGTAAKESDVDLLFILANLKNRAAREEIERECSGYRYSHNIRISPLIAGVKDFVDMLQAKGINVGKEAMECGVPIYGSEFFWRLIA